jgi:hypothetical protein
MGHGFEMSRGGFLGAAAALWTMAVAGCATRSANSADTIERARCKQAGKEGVGKGINELLAR